MVESPLVEKPSSIRAAVPENAMSRGARLLRDTYAITPGAPFFQREFGWYCMERWQSEGHLKLDTDHASLFGFDKPGNHYLGGLGWCEAAFCPVFEEKVIENRGEHEVAQDFAGRQVLYFTGRRSGFMPEYLDHPVKDKQSWEEKCKWRLDPNAPNRFVNLEQDMAKTRAAAAEGLMIGQQVIGGMMYLRSLMGVTNLLYKFCEDPALIHDCMKTWFTLADAVIARHQERVTLDELFLAEDICYNNGPLISPDMMREFLFPYYQQLIANIRVRQLDASRHLYIQIDTDGQAATVIDVYKEIGMDVMSPFEVASGSDVVAIGREYPDLVMTGGIDKRVLAEGPDAINAHVDRIFPAMFKRGGYLPTCDHGVPAEVSFENYMHYRKRCLEYAG